MNTASYDTWAAYDDTTVPVVPKGATFSEATQAVESRRYGGIHISAADLHGRELGREVAKAVWKRGMRHILGEVE